MLRSLLTLLATVSAVSVALATPPESETARKVRVALALAGGCGTCRSDLEDCRADAIRTNKPLVLFIGGCDGLAKELDSAAIYCRVAEYKIESKPAEGVVVLGKLKGERDGVLFVLAQLPKAATPAEIREAVKVAVGKAPSVKVAVPLEWDFGGSDREPESAAEDEPEPAESDAVPIGFQLQDCPGGRCAVPTSGRVAASPSAQQVVSGSSEQPIFSAPARRRIFEAKPVRSFLCRLFGRCR